MAQLKDFSMSNIDWDLTPEQAVTMYLEWGNNDWKAEYPPVRSKDDVSLYFVLDNWGDEPIIRLVRRNSENAEDLFAMPLPTELRAAYYEQNGNLRGISAPTPAIKAWLKKELGQEKM